MSEGFCLVCFFVVVVVAVVVPNYFEPASKKGKRRDLRAVGMFHSATGIGSRWYQKLIRSSNL